MCNGKYCNYCGKYYDCNDVNKNKHTSSCNKKVLEYNRWIPYNETEINTSLENIDVFCFKVLMKFNSSIQFGMFHRLEEEGNKLSIYSPEKDRFIDMDVAIPDYIMIINEEII